MGRDKREKEKRQPKAPGYVALPWDLLNAPAYVKLPPSAAKALIYFRGKPQLFFLDKLYLITDFVFTYPEAKKLGFAKATWAKVLRELVQFGFLDPVSKGGLRGYGKACSQFRLSDRWKYYGQKEFENIDLKTWGT